jgi:uncharacterized membrane protein
MPVTKPRHNVFRRALRIVTVRPRLFIAALFGIAVGLLLPEIFLRPTRVLIGWDAGVLLYLILAFQIMATTDIDGLRRHAARQDVGRTALLVLTAGAALASLGAILAELGGTNKAAPHLILAASTILLSWMFTHTIFALHYAYEYYDVDKHRGGGLAFPGDEPPDYWDFLYFSLVIGMTSQVSDVAVTSNKIRRMVAGHGVVSFVFNATLLALTVNIAASLL